MEQAFLLGAGGYLLEEEIDRELCPAITGSGLKDGTAPLFSELSRNFADDTNDAKSFEA